MNKEEIVEELNRYVKSIDERFEVIDDGDLNLKLGIAYLLILRDWNKKQLEMGFEIELKDAERVVKTGIISKFYKKAVALIDDVKQKKYTVQFTKSEIDDMKACSELGIDWDKAIIKEVKSNE